MLDTVAPKKKRAKGPWAKALIRLRKKTGLKQWQLAELLFSSLRTEQAWESGERTPKGAAKALINQLLQKHGLDTID